MSQRPVAVGLLLCEQVIVEEKTRNVTPVNCFTRRGVSHLPADPVPFALLAVLTDGLGAMALEVVIQRLDNLEEVYRHSVNVRFTDPLQEVYFVLRIRGCGFPVAGYYQVSLLANQELIAQRRIRIVLKESANE